jgi:hypothetical protein
VTEDFGTTSFGLLGWYRASPRDIREERAVRITASCSIKLPRLSLTGISSRSILLAVSEFK